MWARTQLAESVAVAYSTTDTHSLAHQQSINYHGLCVNNDPVVHKYTQLRAQCLPCAIQKKRQHSAKTEEKEGKERRGERGRMRALKGVVPIYQFLINHRK